MAADELMYQRVGIVETPEAAGRIAETQKRWTVIEPKVEELKRAILTGDLLSVESRDRIERFARRRMAQTAMPDAPDEELLAVAQERWIADNDLLSVEFLEMGLAAAQPVGRLSVLAEVGTAFHVGENVILTNHHVLSSAEQAAGAVFELDAEDNRFGPPKAIERFALDPDRFFITDKEHDFTFVAVEPRSDNDRPLADYGWIPLDGSEGKILKGQKVNIVGHPGGRGKQVAIRNNSLLFLEDKKNDVYCYYSADTEQGNSGSPVFNDSWELVALHHQSVPKTNKKNEPVDANGRPIGETRGRDHPELFQWVANEGIRISRLMQQFTAAPLDADADADEIRQRLITLWSQGPLRAARPPVAPPAPAVGFPEGAHVVVPGGSGNQTTVTIPLSITISLG